MRTSFHRAFQRALTALTNLACRSPKTLVAVALLAAAGAAWYVVADLTIDTDTSAMLADDLRYRQLDRELNQAFPQDPRQLLVVVEGENPDLVADATRLLTEVLRNRPDLFHSVFDPRGDPFFRRNALLYPSLEELEELSDRLTAAQPFLGALWRDRTLRGFFEMLGLAAENAADDGAGAGMDIVGVLDSVAAVVEAQVDDRYARLSWMNLMTGGGDGLARRIIIVQPDLNYGQLRPAGEAIEAIRSIAEDLGFDGTRDVQVRLTGAIALNDDELQSVTVGMSAAGALSLTLVLGLLLIGLRSPRTVAAAIVTLLVGLVLTAAFAVAAVGSLNLISVAFAVLFIGLSVDFSIHYALRFREEAENGDTLCANLHATVRAVGGALALTAVAAAIGFVSFVPTQYTGLAELGIIAAAGMIIALLCNLTVLPAMIMLVRPRLARPVHWETDWQARIAAFVAAHARTVTTVAAVLGIGAAALVPRAHFDFDPLNLKDPESPSVATLLDLMAEDPRQGYAAVYLADDLAAAERLADRVADEPTVAEARTLADFVPDEQAEKRDILDTLALVLEPALTAPRAPLPTPAETRAARVQLMDALRGLAAAETGDAATRAAASRLLEALERLRSRAIANPGLWTELEARLIGGLSQRLEALRDSLHPDEIVASKLPVPIRERWMASDGRARLEIYPEAPIHRDRDAMTAFLHDVRAEIPDAVGAPVKVYEAGRTVVRALLEAAAIAIAAISVLLLVIIRSVRTTLVIFAPLVLAAVLTVATTVLLGIPFNFANVIVLPLLFGLGVAGSLHIVLRQGAQSAGQPVLSTSTPRAVLYSTLTTIASFVSLNLSDHPGTASMGLLLAIALVLTLVCTLLVLPAVMALAGGMSSDGESAAES